MFKKQKKASRVLPSFDRKPASKKIFNSRHNCEKSCMTPNQRKAVVLKHALRTNVWPSIA